MTQPWTGAGGGSAVTGYGYDVQDHLTRVTDAEGNITTYTYSDLVQEGCQFLIATHSPILLAYPDALLYELSEAGIQRVEYEQTEHFRLTRDFLVHRERFFRELFCREGGRQTTDDG